MNNALKQLEKNVQTKMSNPMLELEAEYDADPREYIEQNLYIKTKDKRIAPFIFNEAQVIVYKAIQKLRELGKPVRIVILKARQEGVSTLVEGLIFEKTARWHNTSSLIIAHEPDSTDAIFKMSKLFYDKLEPEYQPMRRYDNKKQMVFENPDEKTRAMNPGLRSQMVIATANKVKMGRGITLHCFHGSEVAFWNNAPELMLAVMQAIPDDPSTMVFLESTANGFGGDGEYFYNIVQGAISGKNDFTLIFLPWHLMLEYSSPFESDKEKKAFAKTLDAYEKDILKEYELTLEQLNWRRWAIKNKTGGDVEKFKQEYPITIEEAFVASAKTVIPKAYIEAQRNFVREPIEFFDGDVAIYEKPNPRHYYALGGDPSEGLGMDDSAITVIDKMTGREVASYANDSTAPDLFGRKMVKLAKYFNNAIIVPEINAHGLAMLNAIRTTNYPNIFRQRYFDHTSNQWTRRLGWKTTKLSKPLMVDEYIEGLREEEVGMSTQTTITQMLTFVHTDDAGKHSMGAESGQKDDRLISGMLAWQGLKDLPSTFKNN